MAQNCKWDDLVFSSKWNCYARRVIEVANPAVEVTDSLIRIGWRQIQQSIALERQLCSNDRTEVILPVDGLGEKVFLRACRRRGSGPFPYIMKDVLRFQDVDWSRFEPNRSSKGVDVGALMNIAVKAVQGDSLAYASHHALEHHDRLWGLKVPDNREKSVALIKRVVYQSVRCAAGCLSSVKLMIYRRDVQLAIPVVGDFDNEYKLHSEIFLVLRFHGRAEVYCPTFLTREQVLLDVSLPREFLKKKAA
ncbi:hypothetical protein [Fibrobacter sp. UBA4297]|uniref:hypothetical protein n=1 Tax=Fibrobacter sp. UBA4297 TaxID=1946536 RepID=UPI0025C38ADB|nr:hypothetical protein [Fibrobacter sp. UBA4297]